VDAYFKELETLLIKVEMHDSEEAEITRFVFMSIHLWELWFPLPSRLNPKLQRKMLSKTLPMMNTTTTLGKIKNSFSKLPSKDFSFKPKESKPSTSIHKSPIKSSSKKCFKCLGYGHIASNCPSKRNMFVHNGGSS